MVLFNVENTPLFFFSNAIFVKVKFVHYIKLSNKKSIESKMKNMLLFYSPEVTINNILVCFLLYINSLTLGKYSFVPTLCSHVRLYAHIQALR